MRKGVSVAMAGDVPTSCLARGGHRPGRAASTERDSWPALTWASPVPCGEERGFSDPGAQGKEVLGRSEQRGQDGDLPCRTTLLLWKRVLAAGGLTGRRRMWLSPGDAVPIPTQQPERGELRSAAPPVPGLSQPSGAPAGTRPRCSLRPGHQQKSSFPGSERARGPHRLRAMAGRGTWSRSAAE